MSRERQALEFYISYVVNQADVKWLINRVEELEEALMFYADEETYETKFATDTDEIFDPFTLIELDEGKKARKVLKVIQMSKERLEEIIKSLENKAVIDRSDYEWLIEQAEKLQELRKRYLTLTKENNQVNDELIDVFRENKRYCEALEEIRALYPLRNVGYQVSEIRKIVIKALEGEK